MLILLRSFPSYPKIKHLQVTLFNAGLFLSKISLLAQLRGSLQQGEAGARQSQQVLDGASAPCRQESLADGLGILGVF